VDHFWQFIFTKLSFFSKTNKKLDEIFPEVSWYDKIEGIKFPRDTSLDGTFTDERDNHLYKSVQIGNQTWMAENLAYLPSVSPSNTGSETKPNYYVYNYQGLDVNEAKTTANYSIYGVLYNFEAAQTACPSGWHLPSTKEWQILVEFLGGESVARNKLSETGTAHWINPKSTATNSSSFTAFPGGGRDYDDGKFSNLGAKATFWSSSKLYSRLGLFWVIETYDKIDQASNYNNSGYSVRCLQDN